jgi:CDP-diacylglycerol--glycerol-3-phosphate 3-phosphatidyltransferase
MTTISLTTSNILTLIRLIGAPIIMPFLLWYGLPQRRWEINIMLAAVFGALGLTDFLDGYLARRFSQETELGKLLDPIADKTLVFSSLISLMAAERIAPIIGFIIIGRELLILAMREYAQRYYNAAIPVSWVGKVKTTFQFFYLGIIMLNNRNNPGAYWIFMEHTLLTGTVFFTLYSLILYYHSYIKLATTKHEAQNIT